MGLFGFGKKKEEKALAPCACREGAAARKAVMPMATSGAISGMLPLYWATS